MRILTTGIKELDREKFKTDGKIMLNKPFYGLYGSTVTYLDCKLWSNWLDFVVNSGYNVDKYIRESLILFIKTLKFIQLIMKKII